MKHRPRPYTPLLALAALGIAAAPPAQTVTVIDADRDATIFSENDLAANGTGSCFHGQTSSGNLRRALLHFDVSSIPSDATIVQATLTVDADRAASGASFTNTAHRLTADWTEGSSFSMGQGAPAMAGDVTWRDRSFGVSSWTNPGGDFDAMPSAMGTWASLGPQTMTGAQLASDVAGWIANPGNNYGLIVLGTETGVRSAFSFRSREIGGGNPAQLEVTWLPAATVTTLGPGCQGLTLAASAPPSLGTTITLNLSGGPTNLSGEAALFSTAALPGPVTLFGCPLWIDPTQVLAAIPFNAQRAINLSVGTDLSNLGLSLTVQGAGIDVAGSSVVTSTALTLTVGG